MPATQKIEHDLIEHIYQGSITCIFDENFSILYANKNFSNLVGYTEDELNGTSLLKLKHESQTDNIYNFIINTLSSNEIWKGEFQLSHRKKHAVSMDTIIKPAIANNKKRYIATFIDISAQKQLIDNLKQRAHRQGLIAILGQLSLNNIPINDLIEQTLSVICGSLEVTSGMILEISTDVKSTHVRASYNGIKKTSDRVTIPIEKNNIIEYTIHNNRPTICQNFETESRFDIPESFKTNNINSAICIIIGDKNSPFGVLTLLSDKHKNINIDESYFLQSICNIIAEAINRKNIEQALLQEKELSRNYLDAASVVFIVLDAKEKILMANRHASFILGISQDELIGINFFDCFFSTPTKKISREIFEKIKNKQAITEPNEKIFSKIMPIINNSGETKQIKWKISTLFDNKNSISAILYTGEDISDFLIKEEEQKSLEKKLHQAQKLEAIGMLASGIAHDFNNILASILGFSELAFEAIEDKDSTLYDYISQIQTSGLKAKDIIEQMQNINLQDESSSKEILLPSLLKGTLKMLRSALPSSINMQVNISNNTPAVHINASKFNQIVMHLLTNSRNAIKGKGTIEINLTTEDVKDCVCQSCKQVFSGRFVSLSIHDNGPGIKQNIIENCFSNTNKNNSGLPFISNVTHQTNGHILIEDSHLGKNTPGTCIKLLFEISNEQSKVSEYKKDERDLLNLENKHIMVIDDENSIATYLGEMFKSAGFSSSVFCDSVEALSAFENNPEQFDLIVSDQTMPIINGDILALKMMKIRPDIPIIICSGDDEMLNNYSADDLHINSLLKKPVNSAELLHSVVNSLAASKAHCS